MREDIISTLREKLFEQPGPFSQEGLFHELAGEMFPSRTSFLRFLEERQVDAQVEAAKQVLLRLGYEARIFPPNKFLFNLLEVECLLAGTTTKGHFYGRDHFVHLVNLYLLGLYVFWYHADLHHKVVEQFKQLTSPSNLKTGQSRDQKERRRTAIRAFIAAWRDFVIFHDLGYPWEANPSMEEGARYLTPFGDILRYAAKDESLFALSHLIAFEWLRTEEAPTLQDELSMVMPAVGRHDEQELPLHNSRALAPSLLEAQRLPNAGDPLIMRFVRLFVPESDLIPVLESTAEDLPVASTHGLLHKALQASTDADLGELSSPEALARHAQNATLPPKLRGFYRWVYYAESLDKHLARFQDALLPDSPGHSSCERFQRFARDFIAKTPLIRPEGADPHFTDHTFCVFQGLLGSLDFDDLDEVSSAQLFIKDHLIDEGRRKLEQIFHGEVAKLLGARLEKYAEKLKTEENIEFIKTPPRDYLGRLLEPLRHTRELADDLNTRISGQLRARIDLKGDLYHFYSLLKRQIIGSLGNSLGTFAALGNEKHLYKEPDWKAFAGTSLADAVGVVLKRRKLDGLGTLMNFRPSFAPPPALDDPEAPYFADHGVASGLLYADLQRACSMLAQTTPTLLLRLLNLRGGDSAWNMVGDSSVPTPPAVQVAYTIFVHNLYPREFSDVKHRDFRTRSERDQAFTFLALLCDSLQPWDRKRLFNQGTDTLPYNTRSSDFNLAIRDGFFYITEHGTDLRVEERIRALRQHLDQFLDGAASMVKLSLSEWRPSPGAG